MFGLAPYIIGALIAVGVWGWNRTTIISLENRVKILQHEIDDPMTGWRRNLAVCIQNSDMFSMTIEIVSAKIDYLKAKADQVAEDQKKLGLQAQRDGKLMREDVRDILTRPVAGDTTCERALSVMRAPNR